MLERTSQFVEKLKANRKISNYNEDHVKQGIILPLLQLLGWDPSNIDEVNPEYTAGKGRVDYSLRIKGENRFFIEAKKPTEDLDEHQEQLLNYSYREGVDLAALTNGITWWFYLPKEKGNWHERKFYTVDILEQDTSDIAQKLIDILSKDKVQDGHASKYAEEIYKGKRRKSQIDKTIPEAWNKILSDSDTLLVDLLIETTGKLCGFTPDKDTITEFLKSHHDRFIITETGAVDIKKAKHKRSKISSQYMTKVRIPRKLGRKGYRQIQNYIIPVIKMMRQGISHTEAFQKCGDTLGVLHSTVRSQCTRQLGKTTNEFVELVSNGTIVSLLKKRYPNKVDIIEKELG